MAKGSFSTGSGDDYSADKFYCQSTDGHGRTTPVRVSIKPEHSAEIARMVQSGKYPDYTTTQDFIRDAIHHRLNYLAAHFEPTPDFVKRVWMLNLVADAETRTTHITANEDAVAKISDTLKNVAATGNRKELKALINRYEVEVEGFDQPWRGRLQEVIEGWKDGKGPVEGAGK